MDANCPRLAVEAAVENAEKAVAEMARAELHFPSALLRLIGAVRNLASEAARFDSTSSLPEFEQRMFVMLFAAASGAAQDVAIKNTAFLDFTHEMSLAFDDLARSVDHAKRS